MNQAQTFFGVLVAIFLLFLGVLLITGILDFLLRIIGVLCILTGLIVGGIAILGRGRGY